jgi:hypothetical protein
LEEVAFWNVEGLNPDREVLRAVRPTMQTIPNAKLFAISSPYAKTGILYETYREYFGEESEDVLVWQASSLRMNPTLSEERIRKETEKDPEASLSEYDALFREDLETFLSTELIERAIIPSRLELPPVEEVQYQAFCDPSGGRQDAFTLAIGHVEGQDKIIDVLKGKPAPCDPHEAVKEFADVLTEYGVRTVTVDRYAGDWVVKAFEAQGITAQVCSKVKSDIYLEAEPAFTQGAVELPQHKTLLKELRQLERVRRSGKDRVDHPPRLHDDYANAVAGVLYLLTGKEEGDPLTLRHYVGSHTYICLEKSCIVHGGMCTDESCGIWHVMQKMAETYFNRSLSGTFVTEKASWITKFIKENPNYKRGVSFYGWTYRRFV